MYTRWQDTVTASSNAFATERFTVAVRLRRFQLVPLILIPPRNSHPYLLDAMTFVNRWPLTLRAPIVQEFTLLLLPRKNKVRGKKRFPTAKLLVRSLARGHTLPAFVSFSRDLQALMVELSLSSLNVKFYTEFFFPRGARPILDKNDRKRNPLPC